jgi:hypothetical protein
LSLTGLEPQTFRIGVGRATTASLALALALVFKTLAKLASSLVFLVAKSETNWPNLQKLSVRGEKILARLVSGFCIFTRQA